LVKQAVACVV
jgi:hypothetical protein